MDKSAISMFLEEKLLRYAQKHYSVMLNGLHGVGKTSLITRTFEEMGWSFIVYNCATLNAYTDITGVPMEGSTVNVVSNENVECLVKRLPEAFASDRYDAIFFDEVSRANRETMNGLFQLLQFKQINGYQLKNLKVIWGAYNPYNPDADEDEQTYHVNQLDPAFEDRFRIHITLPYELNENYLKKKHGELALPFMQWWNDLPYELRLKCSPRRLEESIVTYKDGFGLEDVLFHDELQVVLPNLKEKILLATNALQVQDFISTLASKNVEQAAALIHIENVDLVLDAIKTKKLNEQYLKAINQDVLAQIIMKREDAKLEKVIDNLLNKDTGFHLSPMAKHTLEARRNLLDKAIEQAFAGYNEIKANRELHEQNEKIVLEYSKVVYDTLLQYRSKASELQVKKTDLPLTALYDALKKRNDFRNYYCAAVYLWLNWRKTGMPERLRKQQDWIRTGASHELMAIVMGLLFKMTINDKEYVVFKQDFCQNLDVFMEAFPYNNKDLANKMKWWHYGLSDKGATRFVTQFFEKSKTNADLDMNVYSHKW